jgi:hypothetical protein
MKSELAPVLLRFSIVRALKNSAVVQFGGASSNGNECRFLLRVLLVAGLAAASTVYPEVVPGPGLSSLTELTWSQWVNDYLFIPLCSLFLLFNFHSPRFPFPTLPLNWPLILIQQLYFL